MSDGRGRRVALGAAIAFWVAVVVAREWRRALPAWVEAPEQPPSPAPPAPPPPEPAAETWVAPPPVAAPVAPPRAPIPPRPSPPPAGKPARKSRRKIVALLGVVLLAGALAGASLGLRSNTRGLTSFQGETGSPTTTTGSSSTRFGPFCVRQRAGWKSQWVVSDNSGTPPALVMTNFRFGAAPAAWGLFDPSLHWTARDVMIAVADWTTTAKGSVRAGFPPGSLRIGQSDVASFGPAHVRVGHKQVRFHGRLLALYVEARPQTAAALVAANSLLAGVRICSP